MISNITFFFLPVNHEAYIFWKDTIQIQLEKGHNTRDSACQSRRRVCAAEPPQWYPLNIPTVSIFEFQNNQKQYRQK